MAERDVRERDILVASNEYAYVQDLTKGDIVLYVGPTKISLSNTERLVELRADRFVPVRAEDGAVGVSPFVSASSAQYIVLENPPREAGAKPVKGSNSSIELLQGRKVVVPGPATFPLWPGQKAVVVNGHALREDQYLRVRVYDRIEGEELPIGAERIVKGSETSFYIPRTGLEVVPEGREWVRNAVTLLDGQYCILQGPRGERRYRRGPAVVFPEATEEFVVRGGAKVFAAHAVKREMGLHVRAVKASSSSPARKASSSPPSRWRSSARSAPSRSPRRKASTCGRSSRAASPRCSARRASSPIPPSTSSFPARSSPSPPSSTGSGPIPPARWRSTSRRATRCWSRPAPGARW
jgi:major vault protein